METVLSQRLSEWLKRDLNENASQTIERVFQEWVALKVKEFVSRSVLASVDSVPTTYEMETYRQFERVKLSKLADRMRIVLSEIAIPAALEYLRYRFPQETDGDFPRFEEISFCPEFTLSTNENILSGTLPTSKWSLWNCGLNDDGWARKIVIKVMLDSVFIALGDEEIDDEIFDDFILKVLLHEVMHALSVSFYMTDEKKIEAYGRWLAFLEQIGMLERYPSWDELVTRFWLSCNFVWPKSSNGESPYRTFGEIDSINEALTDVYAARAYSYYRKTNGLQPLDYSFGYPKEAKAFNVALKEFCTKHGYDLGETFRMVELGYFFGDEDYLDAFENVIWETVPRFREELARLRAKSVESVS